MRLVEGKDSKSLSQAIRDLHTELPGSEDYEVRLRQLLRRLVDVCNTVAYAHSKGVCHRDLKPKNILLGPFGETLVMDWGLAKVFHNQDSSNSLADDRTFSPSSPTSSERSGALGTFGYTAPEIYGSEPIVHWPQVDVYSLGAILLRILVDHWINRNRKLALASIGFATLLGIALGFIAIQQTVFNGQLKIKNELLDDALAKERKARQQSQLQQTIAHDREQLAVDALQSYRDAILKNESLKRTENLKTLRRELLEQPIQYYEKIQANEKLQTRPSWEYLSQLASISDDIATLSFEFGDSELCMRWASTAIERFSQLVEMNPIASDDEDVSKKEVERRSAIPTIGLARNHRLLGILKQTIDRQSALANFDRAASLLDSVPPKPEWNERLLDQKGSLYANRAALAAEMGDVQQAMQSFDIATKNFQELLSLAKQIDSSEPPVRDALIRKRELQLESVSIDQAHIALGVRYGSASKYFKQLKKYIGLIEQRIERGEDLEQNQVRLAWTLQNLGMHQMNYGQGQESIAPLLASLKVRQAVVESYPSVTRYRTFQMMTKAELSNSYARTGDYEKSIEYRKQCVDDLRKLIQDFPAVAEHRIRLVDNLNALGLALAFDFQDIESRMIVSQAMEAWEQAEQKVPNNPILTALYPQLLEHHALNLMLEARWKEAADALSSQWNALSKINNQNLPQSHFYSFEEKKELLALWSYCCRRSGDTTGAEEADRKLQELAGQQPDQKSQDPVPPKSELEKQFEALVQEAQRSIASADQALMAEMPEKAYELQRSAQGKMVAASKLASKFKGKYSIELGGFGTITEPERMKLYEIRELTLLNPWFTSVRNLSELSRWPEQDRQAWQQRWSDLEALLQLDSSSEN